MFNKPIWEAKQPNPSSHQDVAESWGFLRTYQACKKGGSIASSPLNV